MNVTEWQPISPNTMPDLPDNYLVAFSDGTVETFSIGWEEIKTGRIHIRGYGDNAAFIGEFWADAPEHPTRHTGFNGIIQTSLQSTLNG